MFCVSVKISCLRLAQLSLISAAVLLLLAVLPGTVRAQRTRSTGDTPDKGPLFSEFKGVKIGMPTDEARKKLGSPRDKSDDQDFYVFNDTQAVQVFYDKSKTVSAISIDFMSGANDIPAARDVIGGDPDTKPDGSLYKMVRYPKAGYWVAYSKSAGNAPTITITIQKIEH